MEATVTQIPSKTPNILILFSFALLLISKIIHLQILFRIIQIFSDDFQGCAILTHFFQCLIHLFTNSSVIIFCKSNSYPGKHQENKSITLSIKAGEGGKAFGSVSSKEIAKAIKDQLNLDIDKKKLVLPEPIKTFGTHEVPIKLHKEVTGKLAVKVVEA